MIPRNDYEKQITTCLGSFPINTLTGPRQSGKTTLATQIYRKTGGTYLDMGRRSDRFRLSNPESFLASLKGLVVIDEIQEMPGLFNVLRAVVDDPDLKARFLVLGSASPGI
ncbi:MAG: AAA family ATPase [Candidatus Aegiribacteria sp.]|nr:AAA family ATPase [Candidatus Aegiribacteria sp.]